MHAFTIPVRHMPEAGLHPILEFDDPAYQGRYAIRGLSSPISPTVPELTLDDHALHLEVLRACGVAVPQVFTTQGASTTFSQMEDRQWLVTRRVQPHLAADKDRLREATADTIVGLLHYAKFATDDGKMLSDLGKAEQWRYGTTAEWREPRLALMDVGCNYMPTGNGWELDTFASMMVRLAAQLEETHDLGEGSVLQAIDDLPAERLPAYL